VTASGTKGAVSGVEHGYPFKGGNADKAPLAWTIRWTRISRWVRGGVLAVKEVREFVLSGVRFVGKDEGMGVEAVLEAVERRTGFASGRVGPVDLVRLVREAVFCSSVGSKGMIGEPKFGLQSFVFWRVGIEGEKNAKLLSKFR